MSAALLAESLQAAAEAAQQQPGLGEAEAALLQAALQLADQLGNLQAPAQALPAGAAQAPLMVEGQPEAPVAAGAVLAAAATPGNGAAAGAGLHATTQLKAGAVPAMDAVQTHLDAVNPLLAAGWQHGPGAGVQQGSGGGGHAAEAFWPGGASWMGPPSAGLLPLLRPPHPALMGSGAGAFAGLLGPLQTDFGSAGGPSGAGPVVHQPWGAVASAAAEPNPTLQFGAAVQHVLPGVGGVGPMAVGPAGSQLGPMRPGAMHQPLALGPPLQPYAMGTMPPAQRGSEELGYLAAASIPSLGGGQQGPAAGDVAAGLPGALAGALAAGLLPELQAGHGQAGGQAASATGAAGGAGMGPSAIASGPGVGPGQHGVSAATAHSYCQLWPPMQGGSLAASEPIWYRTMLLPSVDVPTVVGLRGTDAGVLAWWRPAGEPWRLCRRTQLGCGVFIWAIQASADQGVETLGPLLAAFEPCLGTPPVPLPPPLLLPPPFQPCCVSAVVHWPQLLGIQAEPRYMLLPLGSRDALVPPSELDGSAADVIFLGRRRLDAGESGMYLAKRLRSSEPPGRPVRAVLFAPGAKGSEPGTFQLGPFLGPFVLLPWQRLPTDLQISLALLPSDAAGSGGRGHAASRGPSNASNFMHGQGHGGPGPSGFEGFAPSGSTSGQVGRPVGRPLAVAACVLLCRRLRPLPLALAASAAVAAVDTVAWLWHRRAAVQQRRQAPAAVPAGQDASREAEAAAGAGQEVGVGAEVLPQAQPPDTRRHVPSEAGAQAEAPGSTTAAEGPVCPTGGPPDRQASTEAEPSDIASLPQPPPPSRPPPSQHPRPSDTATLLPPPFVRPPPPARPGRDPSPPKSAPPAPPGPGSAADTLRYLNKLCKGLGGSLAQMVAPEQVAQLHGLVGSLLSAVETGDLSAEAMEQAQQPLSSLERCLELLGQPAPVSNLVVFLRAASLLPPVVAYLEDASRALSDLAQAWAREALIAGPIGQRLEAAMGAWRPQSEELTSAQGQSAALRQRVEALLARSAGGSSSSGAAPKAGSELRQMVIEALEAAGLGALLASGSEPGQAAGSMAAHLVALKREVDGLRRAAEDTEVAEAEAGYLEQVHDALASTPQQALAGGVAGEDPASLVAALSRGLTVPASFVCPITGLIMKKPVSVEGGQTFECEAIKAHFAKSRTNPITGMPLGSAQVQPNYSLQSVIEGWLRKHKLSHDQAAELPTAATDEELSAPVIPPGALEMLAEVGAKPLHRAALLGDIKAVRALLDAGADLEEGDAKRSAVALHYAALGGQVDVVRELLGRGARVNTQDKEGNTPLHLADGAARIEVIALLAAQGALLELTAGQAVGVCDIEKARALIKAGANTSATAKDGVTPLHIAARSGLVAMAQALIDAGANKSATDERGITPLHVAVATGHVAMAQTLIGAGANKSAIDKDGVTPLHIAARSGLVAMAQALIDAGANKSATDERGITPLHVAVATGHVAMAQTLIGAGANKSAIDKDDFTPLHVAVRLGNEAMAQALVAAGAPVDTSNRMGYTALHLAAMNGNTKVLQALIDAGADLCARVGGVDDSMPLHLAASFGHVEAVQVLLERGAPLEAVEREGGTALHLGVLKDNMAVVQVLIDKGANKEAATEDGRTPLMYAAQNGSVEMVKVLLSSNGPSGLGANKAATDQAGKTALDWAKGGKKEGHEEVLKLLDDRPEPVTISAGET
ncbi:hypothetical protein HYH03_014084 [Edaphochlamys debaryana]|uniref:U-box domain-containing protein n=1 Tax=Edaphochlamys debaryana TaxID=47281 RepID=A0A836BSL3_9CHLO|nr:hypothetical protein HYH03_014084 [Edaphochlamys debaryana]|eukprot:KAG2487242.1 hypothetical protein HYH03_014084 [Edaphochlamys debaryana]